MGKHKEAVGNLGEEEVNFLKHVRLTRADTRKAANELFVSAPQNRERDQALMRKLLVQAPGAMTMSDGLLPKMASSEDVEQFEKVKVAYNVWHFFESGAHLDAAQRRFPELTKVSKVRPVVSMKKIPAANAPTGHAQGGVMMSGASV